MLIINYPIVSVNRENKRMTFIDSTGQEFSYQSLFDLPAVNKLGIYKFNKARSILRDSIKNYSNVPVLIDGPIQLAKIIEITVESGYSFGNSSYLSHNDNLTTNPSLQKSEMNETEIKKLAELEERKDKQRDFINAIQQSIKTKPNWLKVPSLTWKFLARNVLRSSNILLTGPSGSGKTEVAVQMAKTFEDKCPFYRFNLGSTQDPRTTLIGTIQYIEGEGTKYTPSEFVKAIQTPNAVILLDEISRAHPEAWNILLTVLDEGQRYLQVDEDEGRKVKVAEGVCFIATANIGYKYTSTKIMDRALLDRMVTIEVPRIGKEDELALLKQKFDLVHPDELEILTSILESIRQAHESEDAVISDTVSTRHAISAASLLQDGFTLQEVCEVVIYPIFSEEGGMESERHYVKQIVDGFIR